MADKPKSLHKAWVLAAVAAGLARLEKASITLKPKASPTGKKEEVPFERAIFLVDSKDDASRLYDLAEKDRGTVTVKDENDKDVEVPDVNDLAKLLTYAYGLNCRTKVRTGFEAQFEDPDKALKKVAENLVKSGQFKNYDKALAAARLMREEPDEDES